MTMLPRFRAAMTRPAAWVKKNAPSRLTAINRRQSSGAISSSGRTIKMPALATAPVSPPRSASTMFTHAETASGSVTSRASPRARPPDCSISAATSAAPAPLMSDTATAQPSLAMRNAIARPMPRPAPVMASAPAICSPCVLSVAPDSAPPAAWNLYMNFAATISVRHRTRRGGSPRRDAKSGAVGSPYADPVSTKATRGSSCSSNSPTRSGPSSSSAAKTRAATTLSAVTSTPRHTGSNGSKRAKP